ncbi:MAG: threonine/serine dehydratase [Acidobacteriota bacterium]
MTRVLEPPSAGSIDAARARLRGISLRTPLIPLAIDEAPAQIWLKLENLQPIGSFKIRGAGNAMAAADPADLAGGVYTASAGNMAQGVAWNARRLGVRCRVIVPDHAPQTKVDAIRRLGGEVVKVSFDDWWQIIVTHHSRGEEGLFIHPVCSPEVIAGNATIGSEILEDLPDVDSVVVPYGGGGLSAGIAAAIKARRPEVKILACEVETAAPLAASLAAGEAREIEHRASFVDGIGGRSTLAEMWPLVSQLLDGSLVQTLDDVAGAIRLLARRQHVIAEGAGATSVAAALNGEAGTGRVVCVVSGGNIDARVLCRILAGETPD